MRSKCVNIHDPQSPVYELTDDYDCRRALVKNFFMLPLDEKKEEFSPGKTSEYYAKLAEKVLRSKK